MFTITATATSTGLPAFDDAVICVVVTIFHFVVCVGFDAVAVATSIGTIVRLAVVRLAMGVAFVASKAQHGVLPAEPSMPTLEPLDSLALLHAVVPVVAHFATPMAAPTAAPTPTAAPIPVPVTVSTVHKPSPFLAGVVSRGTHTCVLLTSTTGSPEQRFDVGRARDILHDLGVVFSELDTSVTPLHVIQRYTNINKTHGQYPQLFIEPTTPSSALPNNAITSDEIFVISFGQLEEMEYRGVFENPIPTRTPTPTPAPTPVATTPSTPSTTTTDRHGVSITVAPVTLDRLHPAYNVIVDSGSDNSRINFFDVWDVYTSLKLHSLLPWTPPPAILLEYLQCLTNVHPAM